MNKEYILSDLHLSHKNIIKFCNRPYEFSDEGVKKMNEDLLKLFDELPDDDETIVWNLGDIWLSKAMNDWPLERFMQDVKRMKGNHRKLYLVIGNHDKTISRCNVFKKMKEENNGILTLVDFYKNIGFDKVHALPVIWHDKFILSHEPYYLGKLPSFYNIYGHTHDKNIDELYFTHDEKKWIKAASEARHKGLPEPAKTIDFPERKINTEHYFNACLDANNFKILDLEKVKVDLLSHTSDIVSDKL